VAGAGIAALEERQTYSDRGSPQVMPETVAAADDKGASAARLVARRSRLLRRHRSARQTQCELCYRQAGDLALVSQSGTIAAGLVDWAALPPWWSTGDQVDVDFGDLLDHFAMDPATRAVPLCIESIRDARKFMSAPVAVARAKAVVVIKSGRHGQAAKPAATHTRLGTQLDPRDHDSGESEAREIVSRETVVSGCDATPVL
jgi:hypothetical protein